MIVLASSSRSALAHLAEIDAVTSAEHTVEMAPVLACPPTRRRWPRWSSAPLDAGDASQITVCSWPTASRRACRASPRRRRALARAPNAGRSVPRRRRHGGAGSLVVAGGQVDVVRAFVPDDVLRQGVGVVGARRVLAAS
ncbi:MAG: hypothetical protein R2699_09285 [Acidimicrobiales bacterium]